jgi:dipeptidyl aminopeptidase/acylaminoacyl peptidase
VQVGASGAALEVFTRTAMRVRGRLTVRVVRRRVATGRIGLGDPAWSPDGKNLLFDLVDTEDRVSLTGGLWVVGADGRHLRRLTSHSSYSGASDSAGVWSPDGRRIAFGRYDPATSLTSMVVMNADGSGLHSVLSAPGNGFRVWSPDGRLIAFRFDPLAPLRPGVTVVDAATGAQTATIPLIGDGPAVTDWQALPGRNSTHCADRTPAPLR